MNKNHSPITKLTIAWRNLSTKDFGYKNGNLFSFLHFICDGCNFDKGERLQGQYTILIQISTGENPFLTLRLGERGRVREGRDARAGAAYEPRRLRHHGSSFENGRGG